MNHPDWAALTVQLEPTARKVYEHFNRREWAEAEKEVEHLSDLAHDLLKYVLVYRHARSSPPLWAKSASNLEK